MKKQMQRFTFCFILLSCIASTGAAQTQSSKNGSGKYANINGLKMYYEVHGDGHPLLLLHGAYSVIDEQMRRLIDTFSTTNKVIALEFQGHGRTADINRDITYENLADDAAALLKQLGADSADVVAYSMGAGVGLQLAIRHPRAVRKLALLSCSYSFDGMNDAFKPLVPTITPALFDNTPIRAAYDSLAPDPGKFPILVEKLKKLDMTPFNWEKDYEKIRHRMLLVFGDADVVTVAHARDMYAKLGGTVMGDLAPLPPVQLAILPATTHVGVFFRLDWIIPMIREFHSGKSAGNPFAMK